MSDNPLYTIEHLRFSYAKRRVLDVERLEIREGRTTALVGPNGSGKTSLLKILNDLIHPYDGSVLFRGDSARANHALRAASVYVHQAPFLKAGTVAANVAYGLTVRRGRGLSGAEIARKTESALESLGIASLSDRDARMLSGGEIQRTALARALALEPEVFLLDEPTASSDRESAQAIVALLSSLKSRGFSVIFSSHDERVVNRLADHVVYIEEGRIVTCGQESDR